MGFRIYQVKKLISLYILYKMFAQLNSHITRKPSFLSYYHSDDDHEVYKVLLTGIVSFLSF